MEHLMHARDLLNTTLNQSMQIHSQIHTSCTHLSKINQGLDTTIRHAAPRHATFAIKDYIHRAVPPVSAVLNVNQLVNELGTLVSAHSRSDLTRFLYLIKRFKQALTLLTNTCKLAIPWVHNVKQSLQQQTDVVGVVEVEVEDFNHPYYSGVCKTLRILEELQETEQRCLFEQGILGIAFADLEGIFENLLVRNSLPVQLPSSLFSSCDDESDVSDSSPQPALPFRVVENLEAIIGCFLACDRKVDRCVSIYVKARTTTFATSLQGLDLDYLNISLTEFDSVQDIEGYVDEWARHLEFVVKHLLELEYSLCDLVFGRLDVRIDCFYLIALQSRIQDFIKFANAVTKGKKEAIKLFKMLEVFTTLNNLRHDFNRFFNAKRCSKIKTQTRDLIKNVVNGVFEIFVDLSAQIELQRLMDPPPDGAVPRLVTFVTAYCEELLDDDYRLILDQVLEIHLSWTGANEPARGSLALIEVANIMKSLELNLATWANRYEDIGLSCIFAMNTSCYLSKHLKGTRLCDLMGESWLKRHEDRVEYYTQLYLKECWEKILTILTDNESLTVTNQIKGFTKAFDETYRKQSGWVLYDSGLRSKTCELIARVVVAGYKSYMYKYLGSQNPNKCVKYSVESLENMVSSMFEPRYVSNGNSKYKNLMCKINSLISGTTIDAV